MPKTLPLLISVSLSLLIFAISGARAEDSVAVQLGPGYTSCGELTRFWRGKPVIGNWMSQSFLTDAPEFYNESSFPYVKRPYKQEVDFADFLTTPRLLGGWNSGNGDAGELSRHKTAADADLVYRNADGSLAYRWDLLDLRLTRFVDMGYTDLTLVLDQIPYCLAEKPHLERYGQATPPSDMGEWYVFIRDLCKELERRYGTEVANKFRFRFGTELGDGERIALTQERLHEMYAQTSRAIKSVLPEAKLGPWNEASFKNNQEGAPLKVLELARYAKANNLPFDFASVSSYSIPKLRDDHVSNSNPEEKAEGDTRFFESLRDIFPGVSVEYHEFGILNSQYDVVTNEPGARGGAYRANYLLSMLEHGSVDRLYHWDVFEPLGEDKQQGPITLMQCNAWLYSILEHAAGGKLYVLNDDSNDGNTRYKSALITSPERSFLIVSAFAVDRRMPTDGMIAVSLPANVVENGLPKDGVVKYVALTPERDVYQTVKSDLAQADLLKPEFVEHEDLVARVKLMTTNYAKARQMVQSNYPRYREQMVRSLTLNQFDSRMKSRP